MRSNKVIRSFDERTSKNERPVARILQTDNKKNTRYIPKNTFYFTPEYNMIHFLCYRTKLPLINKGTGTDSFRSFVIAS